MAESVVPYIGTWIETQAAKRRIMQARRVVPYIGTWIETGLQENYYKGGNVVPYIGTWIETEIHFIYKSWQPSRTLYRYVD